MNIELAVELQKKGIMLHRLIFIIFVMQRLALQIVYKDMPLKNTIFMLAFVIVCAILEELLLRHGCFGHLYPLRGIRLAQCLISAGMVIFINSADDSGAVVLALLLLFVVDLFLTLDVTDKVFAVGCISGLAATLLVILIVRMTLLNDNKWMFMFFAIAMLGLVFIVEALAFADYLKYKDNELFEERRKFESIVEKNESILQMQEKVKRTNEQLNIQRINLEKANKQINEANQEMTAQEEIMRYIASSFDISKISNQITDAIMKVKKLSFCAVYIKEGAYLNKRPNYVIKANIVGLDLVIKSVIENIYEEMLKQGETERILHNDIYSAAPYLKEAKVQSLYMKVLGAEEETYGLFIIGDKHRETFKDNMSFYNAIIAQFDIAISNVRIYNNMQHMARKDGLTGINNRIYFNELFNETADKTIREEGCMSVALFDIDKFKNVNDTYGHLAGDEVIKRIATVTEEHIDEYEGFVCRYGGEEFVAVLPNRNLKDSEPIIQALFEKLCAQVVQYNEFEIHLSVSVGLTAYPEVCKNTEDLLKRADWCMYYAKEHGRHQLKVDDGTIEKE